MAKNKAASGEASFMRSERFHTVENKTSTAKIKLIEIF